jgi:hypothetical protein
VERKTRAGYSQVVRQIRPASDHGVDVSHGGGQSPGGPIEQPPASAIVIGLGERAHGVGHRHIGTSNSAEDGGHVVEARRLELRRPRVTSDFGQPGVVPFVEPKLSRDRLFG